MTNVYRFIKLGIASIGFVFGIIVIAFGLGAHSSIPIISGGVIMLLMSIFLIFDGSKVLQDLRKVVHTLETENQQLSNVRDDLESTAENIKQRQIEDKKLLKIRKDLLDKQKKQLDRRDAQIATQKTQLEQLGNNITLLDEQLKHREVMQTNMKKIILTMAQTMDQSNELAGKLGQTLEQAEKASQNVLETARILDRLNSNLKQLKFNSLDLDGDGNITQIEWNQAIELI